MLQIKKALTGAAFVLIALAARANAQDSSPNAEAIAAAHQLIAAQDQAGQMRQVSESMSKMLQAQFSSTDPATAKFMGTFLRNALSPDSPAMKKFLADIETVQLDAFSSGLSVEDMKQLATFLQSDAYKKYTVTNFKILSAGAPMIAAVSALSGVRHINAAGRGCRMCSALPAFECVRSRHATQQGRETASHRGLGCANGLRL